MKLRAIIVRMLGMCPMAWYIFKRSLQLSVFLMLCTITDVRDREIEVRLSEDEQVHIRYFESSKEYYDISVSDGGVLTMVDADSKEWTNYIGKKPSAENRKILLQIPDAS